ncbi:hypothetical protein ACFQ1I_45790 [Kitasatospora arboriphila]
MAHAVGRRGAQTGQVHGGPQGPEGRQPSAADTFDSSAVVAATAEAS